MDDLPLLTLCFEGLRDSDDLAEPADVVESFRESPGRDDPDVGLVSARAE